MARLTTIEAVTVVDADAAAVWQALLDQARWQNWENPGVRLEGAEVADGAFERVGDRRRCEVAITGLPLGRRRRICWDEQVTDVDPERTLEVESLSDRASIRRWRVRFWLVKQPDEQTRLRCHVSYRPVAMTGWLADRLFLRSRVEAATSAWLASLAGSFSATQENEGPVDLPEPLPDVTGRLVAA